MDACILVIEDSQDIRELLCDLLTDEGYAVVVYASPMAAVADLDRIQPDLIILDWLFGREPLGFQVLESLRLRTARAEIPVIICSAATRQLEDLAPFLQCQGIQVVSKPFIADELVATVSTKLQDGQVSLRSLQQVQVEVVG